MEKGGEGGRGWESAIELVEMLRGGGRGEGRGWLKRCRNRVVRTGGGGRGDFRVGEGGGD